MQNNRICDPDDIVPNLGQYGKKDIIGYSPVNKRDGQYSEMELMIVPSTQKDVQFLTQRKWGHYEDLLRLKEKVIKILTIFPDQKISNQKHAKRQEIWTVLQGTGEAILQEEGYSLISINLKPGTKFTVEEGIWHQVKSDDDCTLIVLEIQEGSECSEDDIIRKEDVL